MKKAKYTLYGILALVIILLIVAIFLPKQYALTVDSKIDAPRAVVYNLLDNMDNRAQWDPNVTEGQVMLTDKNNSETFAYTSEEGSVKLVAQRNQNMSELTIHKYEDDRDSPEVLKYTLGDVANESKDSGTNISIEYSGIQSWPFNLFSILKKRKTAKSLLNEIEAVDQIAKERHNSNLYNGYTIVEDLVKEKNFITKRAEVAVESIQQFYVQNLGVLFKDVQDAGLDMDGMPSGLFYSNMDEAAVIDMAAGIPITEKVNIANADLEYIEPRKAIVVDYYGDYNNTSKAHKAIEAYFDDHGYVEDTPVIEEYVTDPTTEKDPSKWLTRITYYIVGQ